MVSLADIKADLPHWPDDLIEQWLLKLANRGPDTGWPPPEPLDGHAWENILGRRPLSWWKEVTWEIQESDLSFENLSGGTRRIVSGMSDAHVNNVANIYAGSNSKARFLSATRYLAKHGTFPKPLVVMRLDDGLSVIDGNHRVTALCFYREHFDEFSKKGGIAPLASHQVWIGTHAAGEVPLD